MKVKKKHWRLAAAAAGLGVLIILLYVVRGINLTIVVRDASGNPAPNARVSGIVYDWLGGQASSVFICVTDDEGAALVAARSGLPLVRYVTIFAVAEDNSFGVAEAWTYTQLSTVVLGPPTSSSVEYQKAHRWYVSTNSMYSDGDWDRATSKAVLHPL